MFYQVLSHLYHHSLENHPSSRLEICKQSELKLPNDDLWQTINFFKKLERWDHICIQCQNNLYKISNVRSYHIKVIHFINIERFTIYNLFHKSFQKWISYSKVNFVENLYKCNSLKTAFQSPDYIHGFHYLKQGSINQKSKIIWLSVWKY